MFKRRDSDWRDPTDQCCGDSCWDFMFGVVLVTFLSMLKHPRYIWRYIRYGEE